MRNLSKKAKTIIAGAAIAGLASAGGAYAYWTSNGSGGGSASVAGGVGAVPIIAAITGSALVPGGTNSVAYTASNTTSSSVSLPALTPTISTNNVSCLPAWFTVGDTTAAIVPAGTTTGSPVSLGGATLTFVDSDSVDQNACKNKTVTLTFN